MRLVVAGSTGRAILNWDPLLDFVEAKGGAAGTILMDPSAADDVEWPAPSRARWKHMVDPRREDAMKGLVDAVTAEKPEVVLLATVLSDVEVNLHAAMQRVPERPAIVGAQHGFFQYWSRYKELSSFDAFLTYGPFFQAAVEDDPRFVAASLPKIDRIRYRPVTRKHRRVLLAPQTHFHPEISEIVLQLKQQCGLDTIIRPHPAAPDLYDDLSRHDFVDFDRRSDLNEVFARIDGVITTGSTIALEALAAAKPVVVLPFQFGEAYTKAGIVADDLTVDGLLRIFSKFSDRKFLEDIKRFLASTTGSDTHNRSRLAYFRLQDIIKRNKQKNALLPYLTSSNTDDSIEAISESGAIGGLNRASLSIDQLARSHRGAEGVAKVLPVAHRHAVMSDRGPNWEGLHDKWVLFPHPSGPMLWLRLGDSASHGIIRWERDDGMIKFILSKLTPGGTFLDAGANAGWFVLRAAQAYKGLGDGGVIAFEPQTLLHGYLLKSIEANGFGAFVEAHRIALGDEDGSVPVPDGGARRSISSEPTGADNAVPMRRLDDLTVSVKSHVDCMKLNIEGTGPLFVAGAQNFIRRHKPTIVSEVNTRKLWEASKSECEDHINTIESMGYRTYRLRPDATLLPLDRLGLDGSGGSVDVVFEPVVQS